MSAFSFVCFFSCFTQRWNHHRISASQYNEPIMYDITDNTDFGICARCQAEGVRETAITCPNCGYKLGTLRFFVISSDFRPLRLTEIMHER